MSERYKRVVTVGVTVVLLYVASVYCYAEHSRVWVLTISNYTHTNLHLSPEDYSCCILYAWYAYMGTKKHAIFILSRPQSCLPTRKTWLKQNELGPNNVVGLLSRKFHSHLVDTANKPKIRKNFSFARAFRSALLITESEFLWPLRHRPKQSSHTRIFVKRPPGRLLLTSLNKWDARVWITLMFHCSWVWVGNNGNAWVFYRVGRPGEIILVLRVGFFFGWLNTVP